jgi:hypothetical protein
MIRPTVNLKSRDRTQKLVALLKDIQKIEVLVGIPENKAPRKKGAVNNAQLLFIHTNGSPLRNIPKRPVIEPAIEERENKAAIANELGLAAKAVLDGKPSETMTHLNRAGMEGQNAARDWFESPINNWPPNTPETIERKGSDRPLVDTGQMRKAIIYVVKDAE